MAKASRKDVLDRITTTAQAFLAEPTDEAADELRKAANRMYVVLKDEGVQKPDSK